jgi:acyl carrier protein
MTRDDIRAVLIKNIGETLDDVVISNIDTTKTMKDVGANSLDIVEIVSRTMRQLKVKIPRTVLNRLENIDALIDLIEENAKAKTAV